MNVSTTPAHLIQVLEREIRELQHARRTLEQALGEARDAEERTATALAAAQKKIITKTYDALPDPADAAIPRRITRAVESSCSATLKALRERWARILTLIKGALRRITDELDRKTRSLRRIEAERLRHRAADESSSGTTDSSP